MIPYYVIENNQLRPSYDFIKHSNRYFTYEENFNHQEDSVKEVVNGFLIRCIESAFNNDTNFAWNQLTKMPYIYRTLKDNPVLFFPVVFHNQRLVCGCGRLFTIQNFFPEISVNRIVIQDNFVENAMLSVNELQDKIMNNSVLKQLQSPGFHLNYHLTNDLIMALEYSTDTTNRFPFVGDSDKHLGLLRHIVAMIKQNYDGSNALKILKAITQIELPKKR